MAASSIFDLVRGNNLPAVEAELATGCDVNSRDGDRMTLLHHACQKGHLEMARLLIEAKAGLELVDKHDHDALFFAIRSQNVAVVELLLDKGKRLKFMQQKWTTPLGYATLNGSQEIMKLLLTRGAKVNELASMLEETPLLMICHQVALAAQGYNKDGIDLEESTARAKILIDHGGIIIPTHEANFKHTMGRMGEAKICFVPDFSMILE